jgi:general secretion pathway protein D
MLGGAIEDTVESVVDKTPILSDLPIIGQAFTSRYNKSIKTNLLIFLTARLINPDGTLYNPPVPHGLPNRRR